MAILFLIGLISCENDLAEVSKFIDDEAVAIEVGETVKMLYSDSGRVEMMIEAPLLHRHLDLSLIHISEPTRPY